LQILKRNMSAYTEVNIKITLDFGVKPRAENNPSLCFVLSFDFYFEDEITYSFFDIEQSNKAFISLLFIS
jgi:hypothetical protein